MDKPEWHEHSKVHQQTCNKKESRTSTSTQQPLIEYALYPQKMAWIWSYGYGWKFYLHGKPDPDVYFSRLSNVFPCSNREMSLS